MRKLAILCIFLVILMVTACRTDNANFPREITINREGKEVLLEKKDLIDIHIMEYDGTIGVTVHLNNLMKPEEGVSSTGTYKWVSINGHIGQEYWTFNVEPNKSGKSRELYMVSSSGNLTVTIKIRQKG